VTDRYCFVIVDDHPLFRGALRAALTGPYASAEIAEAGSFDEVSAILERLSDVDLVLLDLAMPGVRGFSGLMYLRAQYPNVPVVVVSGSDDPVVIRRCMDFGASGFIPKTLAVEDMREAIAAVLAGGVWTPADVDPAASADAGDADPAAGAGVDDAVRGPAQQTDCLRAWRLGSDGEGPRLGDSTEARRGEPYSGRDCRWQDRHRTHH
jgi:DNA-binding NarL/FixJ family response regulator